MNRIVSFATMTKLFSRNRSTSSRQLLSLINNNRFSLLSSFYTRQHHRFHGNNTAVVAAATACRYMIFLQQKRSFAQSSSATATSRKRSVLKKVDPSSSTSAHQLGRVICYVTAESYHLDQLASKLKEQGKFQIDYFDEKDALHLKPISASAAAAGGRSPPAADCEIFLFREGAAVFWNAISESVALLDLVKEFEINPYMRTDVYEESDDMEYEYSALITGSSIQKDRILLKESDDVKQISLDKFAISNAIALSGQLGIWENQLEKFVELNKEITDVMEKTGRLKANKKFVFKNAGRLFALREAINLNVKGPIDTPDFYWDRPELEQLHQDTRRALDVRLRAKNLNDKLDYCMELNKMLIDNLHNRHGYRLEWLIIILIVIEVIFDSLHYFSIDPEFCKEYFNNKIRVGDRSHHHRKDAVY